MRRALLALAGLAALAPAATAHAATPTRPVDLSQVTAEQRVVDTIVEPRRTRARAAGGRTERFSDAQGRTFAISTDVPGVSLQPFADVLAAVTHGDEIARLRVEAVRMEQIAEVCGSPQAVACYAPDDPRRSFDGQLWFAVDDPDVVHTLVHEYGHHVDNQLLNLGHLGACTFANDGSRNWFFERELEDDVLDAGITCRPDGDWEHLLGEVFAEDFTKLNGIQGWVLRSVRAPTPPQLSALAFDMEEDFRPARTRWSPRVGVRRARTKRFRLANWTILDVRATSRRFAVTVHRRGEPRRRVGRGRRVQELVPPGLYEAAVRVRRGGAGRARVLIDAL